jgi:hypothetical protein
LFVEESWPVHFRIPFYGFQTVTSPDAGIEELPNCGCHHQWHQLADKIKSDNSNNGKLGGSTAAMSETWPAAVAS